MDDEDDSEQVERPGPAGSPDKAQVRMRAQGVGRGGVEG